MSKRVFLGGTCANDTNWREEIIPLLEKAGVEYFNPVIESGDWDEEAQQRELDEREKCDFCLYTISPKMTGAYSIAEVTDDSNKCPEKVIFVLLEKDGEDVFDEGELKSLESVGDLVERNGGFFCRNLEAAVLFMYQSTDTTIEDQDDNIKAATESIKTVDALFKLSDFPWGRMYYKS